MKSSSASSRAPRLGLLKPRVPTLDPQRAKPLSITPGATPRLSDRSGHAWAKIRAQVLAEEPICRCDDCRTTLRVLASNEVDHIVALEDGGTDDRSNLRGINHVCHAHKTAAERRRRARGG